MTTTYLSKQAEEVAEHIQELREHTAHIKWQTESMKVRASELASLKEQELAALAEFNNASKDWDTAKQKLNSILA